MRWTRGTQVISRKPPRWRRVWVAVRKKAVRYPNATHASPHFTWAELACKDGTPVPANLRANARRLALALEQLRRALGGSPVHLLSVYRTASHNASVGGARASRHLMADAADIDVPRTLAAWSRASGRTRTRDELEHAIRAIRAVHGVGDYPNGGLHMDARPGPRVDWSRS